ncbi:MAG TPA: hypothetical protein VJN18_14430 [Polyangiaceae bacterium]|nr:hypothetical protein [Polyangiaceae bacterium]
MADLFAAYQGIDAELVAAGARLSPPTPATSPWWLEQLKRFLSARRRRWVIRVGRRGGKSSTLCRLAVMVALFGEWSVPAGDTAVICLVSVKTDEALARLRTIKWILTTLGLEFDERGSELELRGERPVLFKVYPCNIDSVGFTSVLVIGDEVARWESRDTGANPAREVVASLAPTMATQPAAFMVLSSSPWSTDDYHAECFEAGDTAHQVVSHAPSWVANPTISEAETHELEPDERVWSREYAAVPGATISAALDPVDVTACFGRQEQGQLGRAFLVIDASSLRGDGFAWLAGRESDAGELVGLECDAFDGERLRHVSMAGVVEHISARAKAWGVPRIFGDQREEAALRTLFSQQHVVLECLPWSEQSKDLAFQTLRRLMRERRVVLPDHAGLRREMTGIKAHLLPSGRTKYATNGLDFASCVVTLMHAVNERKHLQGGINWNLLNAANTRLNGISRDPFEPPLPHRHSGSRFGNDRSRGFG